VGRSSPGALDSTKGTAMDWAKWHDLYEVSTPLKERLIAVREQIAALLTKGKMCTRR
jgi:hypothetical protein